MILTPSADLALATRAIVFGNIRDPEARVARARLSPRRYDLLAELGTKPRTTYLARCRGERS